MSYAPTMRTFLPMLAAVAALSACGPGAPSNPSELWLANDTSETTVKLIDFEPQPY